MKELNLSFKELLSRDKKLTFLVGAGCSIEAPACLPAGKAMMNSLIQYTCPPNEIQRISNMRDLRFEGLVEIIRDKLDNQLRVIDFYGLCDKPNNQHFFLAEMIKKGHFVLTTNFDFLIEYALIRSNVPKEDIVCVITKNDYENYYNPEELCAQGKKTLYKVHGSTRNIITKEDTRKYLITTLQGFGFNKEGLNVFQVEPFKHPLFINITKHRSLIVLGYSGSDDFDIIPTLKLLKNINNLIWVNFTYDNKRKEKIYEIDNTPPVVVFDENLNQINKILFEVKNMNNIEHIYRVDANTTRLIKNVFGVYPNISISDFDVKVDNWLKENIKKPFFIQKFQIAFSIYDEFNRYYDALRCMKNIRQHATLTGNLKLKAATLSNIGEIYRMLGNYSGALKKFEESFNIDQESGNEFGKAVNLKNIGLTYSEQGDYNGALTKILDALSIFDKLNLVGWKSTTLGVLGNIYFQQNDYSKAYQNQKEALKIQENMGNLKGKATTLANIGLIYSEQKNYPEALKNHNEALKIIELLGDVPSKSIMLMNIGTIKHKTGNYVEAIEMHEKAFQGFELSGDVRGKISVLNNLGEIYSSQSLYRKALDCFQESIQIYEKIGKIESKNALEVKDKIDRIHSLI